MTSYVQRDRLYVAPEIAEFADESLVELELNAEDFWHGLYTITRDFSPRNEALLAQRDALQSHLDKFHRNNAGPLDPIAYRAFLEQIGYLLEDSDSVETIETENVDSEIALTSGPQLVVPVTNARFALNAANARWGSLYDALYGTDAIPLDGRLAPGGTQNAFRAAEVVTRGKEFLDNVVPLASASHADAVAYRILDGELQVEVATGLAGLKVPDQFVGYRGDAENPERILLRNNGLHIELVIDRSGATGRSDAAGIDDLFLESAVSTIMDLEDSVAAVDPADKALGYRNWRDLMRGSLTAEVSKGEERFTRSLNPDRTYAGPDGSPFVVPGRSLLLVRNVGHLMRTDAVLDEGRRSTFEGVLDAVMTTLGSLVDLKRNRSARMNSRAGSIYIVKPKQHGPQEVEFTCDLFAAVEELFALPRFTLKLGLMDEERRTSANLAACIAAAKNRVFFINTGFLDRTGDEIRTSIYAGPFPPKAVIRQRGWLYSYENRNVEIGLRSGFTGRAQIGKGMWAMPELMASMLEQKIDHVRSGASTAWVPSPTAATLHALHYHAVDVAAVREEFAFTEEDSLNQLLSIPLADPDELTPEVVAMELDNNVQSILGYVVRWIDQGVGCSKVPDIHGVELMEDRATLRISSLLLANWLVHEVITQEQLDESLTRLSRVVDDQNSRDPEYSPLLAGNDRLAFEASRRLILKATEQTNGYTEPILHEFRSAKKQIG